MSNTPDGLESKTTDKKQGGWHLPLNL